MGSDWHMLQEGALNNWGEKIYLTTTHRKRYGGWCSGLGAERSLGDLGKLASVELVAQSGHLAGQGVGWGRLLQPWREIWS